MWTRFSVCTRFPVCTSMVSQSLRHISLNDICPKIELATGLESSIQIQYNFEHVYPRKIKLIIIIIIIQRSNTKSICKQKSKTEPRFLHPLPQT